MSVFLFHKHATRTVQQKGEQSFDSRACVRVRVLFMTHVGQMVTCIPGQNASNDWKIGSVMVPFVMWPHMNQSSRFKYFSIASSNSVQKSA